MATPVPQNSVEFSFDEIVRATGASLTLQSGGGASPKITGVATDTRENLAGKLFVALAGENFDGHRFLAQAEVAGAKAVLVQAAPPGSLRIPAFRVASTLDALGELARCHRIRSAARLIAIGGSAGKTTTRNAVSSLLQTRLPGKVHYARGNLNNRIGVPMVLFGLQPSHEVAVVEIGTNVRGEVATLAQVVQPNLAVITLVALEHAAGIGDLDAVENEEGDLAQVASLEVAIGNADDPRVQRQLARSRAPRRLTYGKSADADYRLLAREQLSIERSRIVFQRKHDTKPSRFTTSLFGHPGALAALAAIASAEALHDEPVDMALLEQALAQQLVPEEGRLRPFELADGSLVLDDSYNANPASMLAAIDAAEELTLQRGGRLFLVLGEMRELGSYSVREHGLIGERVASSKAEAILAVGGDAVHIADAARRAGLEASFASSAAEAVNACLAFNLPNSVVLFKASRGVAIDRLAAALLNAKGRL